MGIKSKTNQIDNYKIGGLIFDSKEDYLILKNIDKNIYQTVKLVNDGQIKLKDVFKDIKKINVKECYYDAEDELDGIFLNATSLLTYEDTPFVNDYLVGIKFFEILNINKIDSDSDSD